jgi:hypothetical protein
MTRFGTNLALPSVLLALAVAAPVSAQTATSDDTILKQIIVFGRLACGRLGLRQPITPDFHRDRTPISGFRLVT